MDVPRPGLTAPAGPGTVERDPTAPPPRPWPGRLLALAAGLLVAGPALGGGHALLRDMVFVPRQTLGPDALGLGAAVPRAVPVDAVVAALTVLVPGDHVQQVALVGMVVAAALGAARLVAPGPDGRRGPGALAAAACYAWSPYLAERLLMGHWSLLLAWAALPWVAVWALRVRAGRPGAVAGLVLASLPAALTPTGSLLAAGAALALAGRHRLVQVGVVQLALALPWVVAGAAHPGGGVSDPAGVAAFAARGEGPGGVAVSLLGTGGIWNAGAVPDGRASLAVPLVTAVLVGLAVAGWVAAGRGGAAAARVVRGLVALGVAGLGLAALGAVPPAADALRLAVAEVPGAGLLRDGQKWVAWWALALAAGVGCGVAAAARRLDPVRGRLVAGTAVALCVLAVPDLAWGVGGRLEAVRYPADWDRVTALLAADPAPGDVLVLPVGAVRAFAWNDGRPQLDPAPRHLPRPVIVDDTLVVSGTAVAGEDSRARSVIAAADDPAALAALGVGWVLVERGTPGPPVPAAVRALPEVFAGQWLVLHRVPDAVAAPAPAAGRVAAVVGAGAVTLGMVTWATLSVAGSAITVALRRIRRTPRENT